MARKCVSGFAEAGAAMAQQLDDNDLLNLFSAVGRVVSKRFLLKRPSLDRWQLVIDYLTSAMAFEPREQFRVLYLDKRNNLIADEVMAEGTVDHTPVYGRAQERTRARCLAEDSVVLAQAVAGRGRQVHCLRTPCRCAAIRGAGDVHARANLRGGGDDMREAVGERTPDQPMEPARNCRRGHTTRPGAEYLAALSGAFF